MTLEEKQVIAAVARKLIGLLDNCDDDRFADFILDCVTSNADYLLEVENLWGEIMKFSEMTDKQLLDLCRERFCEYRVCEALCCEEDCLDEDCPLSQLFDRMEKLICGN